MRRSVVHADDAQRDIVAVLICVGRLVLVGHPLLDLLDPVAPPEGHFLTFGTAGHDAMWFLIDTSSGMRLVAQITPWHCGQVCWLPTTEQPLQSCGDHLGVVARVAATIAGVLPVRVRVVPVAGCRV